MERADRENFTHSRVGQRMCASSTAFFQFLSREVRQQVRGGRLRPCCCCPCCYGGSPWLLSPHSMRLSEPLF